MSALAEDQNQTNSTRRLGKIPVRNLWLLMLYASDLYRYLGASKVDVEENPEEITDLVAEILCHHVEERLMRNLSYGYKSRTTNINRVRGRIDLLTTECKHLLEKGKVCCRFDELTINTPRNQYVRSALECLSKLKTKPNILQKCTSLSLILERLGVSKIKPANYNGKSERFSRHDISDQKMIAAADLVFLLALPTELDGQYNIVSPDKKETWLRKLFEHAIRGFYKYVLDKSKYYVHPFNKRLDWQISYSTINALDIFQSMNADIVIEKKTTGEVLIIDTKFNEITTSDNRYHESRMRLRSSYVYQIYAYLRSQENAINNKSLTSIGMLLHPTVDKEVSEMVTIQGHPIWFSTVNLGESATNIRNRLLYLLGRCFSHKKNEGH